MLLQGDVAEAVRILKHKDGKDLRAIGSAQLVQTLIEQELVDEFQLMIDPRVVGGDNGALRRLRLVDCQTTTTGAIIATAAGRFQCDRIQTGWPPRGRGHWPLGAAD
jgi:riboflavin biosynthesis pyrimidine reductase